MCFCTANVRFRGQSGHLVAIKVGSFSLPMPEKARASASRLVTFRPNGGHQDVKELIADVLRRLSISA
jgi:hypothetical protein